MGYRRKFPEMKKRIKMFLHSEEGKITREQAAAVATSLMLIAATVGAKGGEPVRRRYLTPNHRAGLHGSHASHGSHCSHGSHASHGSHGSHASHGSHSSHGSHGSHASHGSHGSHGSW